MASSERDNPLIRNADKQGREAKIASGMGAAVHAVQFSRTEDSWPSLAGWGGRERDIDVNETVRMRLCARAIGSDYIGRDCGL